MTKINTLINLTKKLYNKKLAYKTLLNDANNEKMNYSNADKNKKKIIIKRVEKKINSLREVQKITDEKIKNYKQAKTIKNKYEADKIEYIKNADYFPIIDVNELIGNERPLTKDFKDKLRENRIVDKKQIITQYPIIIIKIDEEIEDNELELLYTFEDNLEILLQKAMNKLYKNKKIKDSVIQLQYVTIKNILIKKIQYTKPEHAKDINKFNIHKVVKEFKKMLENSEVQNIIVGYRIAFTLKEDKTLKNNELYDLKAYSPSQNRKYHALTVESTTLNKLCIYETFLSNSNIKSLKYMHNNKQNHDEIMKRLKDEGEEIEKAVKNGELVKSLELLTKKYNNSASIVFYPATYKDAILINKGEIQRIETKSISDGARIYLYEINKHVAPALFKSTMSKNQVNKMNKKEYILNKSKEVKHKEINNILGFDSETYLDKNKNCIVFNITLYGEINNKQIRESFYGENALIDFVKYIDKVSTKIDYKKSKSKVKIPQIFIYGFNNSRFDNLLIYSELFDLNPSTKYVFSGNSIKYIKYNNIKFFDISLHYQIGGLRETCQKFKLEEDKGVYPYEFASKENLDYIGNVPSLKYWRNKEDYDIYIKENGNNFNMKEYTQKYCMLDSKLVYRLAKIHLKMCNGIINKKKYCVVNCPTSANLALKLFNQVFQDENLKQSPDNIIEKEKQAYKGGRTEVFKKEFKENVKKQSKLKYYDINSAHPSGMCLNMPHEYLRTQYFKDKVVKEDDIISYHLYKAKSKYIGKEKYSIPNLLIKLKDTNISLLETDYAYHWGCELKEAIKNGYEITIEEENIYKCKKVFKDFAEYFYNERLKVKKTNEALSLFYKNVINSLYGKFGQKQFNKSALCNNMSDVDKILNGQLNLLRGLEIVKDKILIEYEEVNDKYESVGNLIRYASYITSTTRCKLSEFMRDVGHENVYYCDTDSVFTTNDPNEKLINNNVLGLWKTETATIKEAVFIAPKVYYYIDEEEEVKRSKGVKASKITIEEYKNLHRNKIESIEKTEKMFFRSLNNVIIDDQERNIKPIYNKRLFNNNNSMAFKNIEEYNNI